MLGLQAKVHAGRAEALGGVFDCVVLRAVDKMPKAVAAAVPLVAPAGWLALMTTTSEREGLERAAGTEFSWPAEKQLPSGAHRIVAFGSRRKPAAIYRNLNQNRTEVGNVAGELCARWC